MYGWRMARHGPETQLRYSPPERPQDGWFVTNHFIIVVRWRRGGKIKVRDPGGFGLHRRNERILHRVCPAYSIDILAYGQ